MKKLFYLFVFLSVCPLIMDAQDIDFPFSQSGIENYESRVHIQRLLEHRMKHRKIEKWKTFPFIDILVFEDVSRDLSKDDILPEYIQMSEFKYPLKPNSFK